MVSINYNRYYQQKKIWLSVTIVDNENIIWLLININERIVTFYE